MSETITKLRPDRDLQCYFQTPSAVAALSSTSPSGFTVSGCWRQQFDWAVVEWNRDNVFEHPQLRNLPDGDLSGIVLSYQEQRTNCIQMDSTLYPTVDWPTLRIWADPGTGEQVYYVPLSAHAHTNHHGSYTRPCVSNIHSERHTYRGRSRRTCVGRGSTINSHHRRTPTHWPPTHWRAPPITLAYAIINTLSPTVSAPPATGAAITLTVK